MGNFGEIIQEASDMGQGAPSQTKIKASINRLYKHYWNKYSWSESVGFDLSIAISSGDNYILAPKTIQTPWTITNRAIYDFVRKKGAVAFHKEFIHTLGASASPRGVTVGGAIFAKPLSSNGTIKVKSTSADDTSQNVKISGKDSSGYYQTETVTLAGTAAVTTSTTWLAGYPDKVEISGVCVGAMVITDSADAVLDFIDPGYLINKYFRYYLNASADADATLYCTGKLILRPLTENIDTPIIDIGEGLAYLAGSEMFGQKEGQSARTADHFAKGHELIMTKFHEQEVMGEATAYPVVDMFRQDVDRPELSS